MALGPLTNLALAIRKEPEISENIKEIIYMGGNIRAPGNVTAAAEFNWWFDAEAAAIVPFRTCPARRSTAGRHRPNPFSPRHTIKSG